MSQENKPKEKRYYDVVIEVITPITVRYRAFAEDEREAAKMVEDGKVAPSFISKPKIQKNRIKSLVVYTAGTVMKLFSYIR